MNEQRFRAILRELIDENPFAIRAVLKILELCFTDAVPTLAVTCEARPRLLVNLGFVARHCASDEEVKAVICHEFLHVLLRHTETLSQPTPARHLAADAVINAILHRQHGPAYSVFMARYYAKRPDLRKLLRPMNANEASWFEQAAHQRKSLHNGCRHGKRSTPADWWPTTSRSWPSRSDASWQGHPRVKVSRRRTAIPSCWKPPASAGSTT